MSVPTLTANSTAEDRDAFIAKLLSDADEILAKNRGNRCAKYLLDYLTSEEGNKLSNDGEYLVHSHIYGTVHCVYCISFLLLTFSFFFSCSFLYIL